MSILAPSSFTGRYAISKAFNDGSSKIQEYIDHYETLYLNRLFGAELCTLFLAGYETVEVYTVLFDPFAYDSGNLREVVISTGVVEMLKGLIFAHYTRQDLGTATSGGHIMLEQEGGSKISDSYEVTFGPYNDGVETYTAIQQRVKDFIEDYPEFKGQSLEMAYYF